MQIYSCLFLSYLAAVKPLLIIFDSSLNVNTRREGKMCLFSQALSSVIGMHAASVNLCLCMSFSCNASVKL